MTFAIAKTFLLVAVSACIAVKGQVVTKNAQGQIPECSKADYWGFRSLKQAPKRVDPYTGSRRPMDQACHSSAVGGSVLQFYDGDKNAEPPFMPYFRCTDFLNVDYTCDMYKELNKPIADGDPIWVFEARPDVGGEDGVAKDPPHPPLP